MPHELDEAPAAQRKLDAILDAIPDLLFELGLDGRYHECYAPRSELLAAPVDQLLGRTVSEVLPAAAAEVVLSALREAHAKGRSTGKQFQLSVPQGTLWFEISVSCKAVAPGQEPRFILLSRDVTERRGAEDALRKSEMELASILGSTVDGILVVDGSGKVLRTNRRFAELWGIPRSLIESGDDEALLAFVVRKLADPAAFVAKVQALYKCDDELTDTVLFADGRVFERSTTPLLFGGANVGRVWSFRDITARERAEAAVVESRNLLRSIIDTAPMRVFWKDRELRYLGCNPAFALDAGAASPDDVVGKDDFALAWSAQAEQYRADDSEILRSGVAKLSFEEPQTGPGGQEKWLRTSKVPLRGRDAAAIGILGIYEDVSEHKRVERRLRMAIEATQVVLWELDLTLDRLTYDRAMLGVLGIPDSDAPESLCAWLERVHPDDRPMFQERVQLALSPANPVFDMEYRMIGGASMQWIHSRARVVLRDAAGMPTLAVGTSVNVTTRREREEAVGRAKSEFLANVSHEIRTPLNGVLGNLQLLEMSNLDAEQKEYLSAIALSGKNLLSLINDILDLSKIEAGQMTLASARFSLRSCIDGLVAMQRGRAANKGISLRVALPDDLPTALVGDELRVRQILLNLVGNAIKFTKEGTITISVAARDHAGARRTEEGRHWEDGVPSATDSAPQGAPYEEGAPLLVEIAVTDTGIGVPADLREAIFKPFVQGDSSITRRYGGTGLGLTICRRLTELMGGRISVESVPGIGSTFRVVLPFVVGEDVGPIAEDLAGPAVLLPLWKGEPLRVLIAEDNAPSRQLEAVLLQKMGHRVTTVEHGEEALMALDEGPFDMVLMDIQMPVMDGRRALAALRARELGTAAHLPVIAVTAYASTNDEQSLLEAGFDGYVRKPLSVLELVDEMRRVLDARREKQ